MSPQRIQRKRTKGWKMPENTVYVGRGSKWGNPWKPVELSPGRWAAECNGQRNGRFGSREAALRWCVVGYQAFGPRGEVSEDDARRELAGKNLACWCSLDQPCHADVLLKIANEPNQSEGGRS